MPTWLLVVLAMVAVCAAWFLLASLGLVFA